MSRIRYSTDGTTAYSLFINNLSSNIELNSATKKKLDGDFTNTHSDNGDTGQTYQINYNNNGIDRREVAWNFPVPIVLKKFGLKWGRGQFFDPGTDLYVLTSTDSTDGVNGNWVWTNIGLKDNHPQGTYKEYTIPDITCKWMRFVHHGYGSSYDMYLYNVAIFGDYSAPLVEFCDINNVPLSGDYPLSFAGNFGNKNDTTQTKQFKIKNPNVPEITKNYRINISTVKYPTADAIVTDHFRISSPDVSGGELLTQLDLPTIIGGGYSSVITITGTLLTGHNDASGYHYYSIDVTEL